MDHVASTADWSAVHLAGSRWPPATPASGHLLCLPIPRTTVVLEGHVHFTIALDGTSRDLIAGPGSVIHFCSSAWNRVFWDHPVRFMGIVFHRDFVRVLEGRHSGNGQPPPHSARKAHHTHIPLSTAGTSILHAVDAIGSHGERSGRSEVGNLVRSIWNLTRAHVANDLTQPPVAGAQRTWRDCVAYMNEHLAEPISRDHVAAAMGIHPNYMSTLFSQQSPHSFQQTLEHLRLERAQYMLRHQPDTTLTDIAHACGFADADYFGRVFRQRTRETPRQWRRIRAT